MGDKQAGETVISIGSEDMAPAPKASETAEAPRGTLSFWREAMYYEAMDLERKAELLDKERWPEGHSPIALRGIRHAIGTTFREWGMTKPEMRTLVERRWGHPELYGQRMDGEPGDPKVIDLAGDYMKAVKYLKDVGEL